MNRTSTAFAAIVLIAMSACTAPAVQTTAKVDSESATALAKTAHQFAEAGRLDEALAELDKALAADPKQPEALRDRAMLRHAAGRQAEALIDINNALPLRQEDNRVVGARCFIRVAAERTDAGLEDCRRALTLSGNRANAHIALGQAVLLLGRPAEARAAFDDALQLTPRNVRALYGRGLARQATGDASGGADDKADALRRGPGASREFYVSAD